MTLQRYQSHKIVEAGKIQGLQHDPDVGHKIMLIVGGKQYDVPENFAARGWPEIGDYFVRYSDGYVSWSPAATFEAGYTLVEDATGGKYEPQETEGTQIFRIGIPHGRQTGVGGAVPQQENPIDTIETEKIMGEGDDSLRGRGTGDG